MKKILIVLFLCANCIAYFDGQIVKAKITSSNCSTNMWGTVCRTSYKTLDSDQTVGVLCDLYGERGDTITLKWYNNLVGFIVSQRN